MLTRDLLPVANLLVNHTHNMISYLYILLFTDNVFTLHYCWEIIFGFIARQHVE